MQIWSWILTLLATLQAAIGLTAYGVARLQGKQSPPLFFAVEIVWFLAVGLFLRQRSRQDQRAGTLGLFLVLVASAFSFIPTQMLADWGAPLSGVARALLKVPADAFFPWVVWRFAEQFPRTVEIRLRRFARLGEHLSLVAGALLLGAGNLSSRFDPAHATGDYWLVVFGLATPGFLLVAYKTRHAAHEERQRVALVVAGVVGAGLPACLFVMLSAFDPIGHFLVHTPNGQLMLRSGRVLLLAMPITAAYAVLAGRAFDVQLALRKTLRYALARALVS